MKISAATLAATMILSAPAMAAPGIAIDSTLYVERTQPTESGRVIRSLEPAHRLTRGDRVVAIVDWRGAPAREAFVVTNPLPRALAFEKSANGAEIVSVDGGRTFGRLDVLAVRDGDRVRRATPEDVTHVRWRVPAQLAATGSGRITYSARVR